MAVKPIRIVIITSPDQLEQDWINRLSQEPDVESVERIGSISAGVGFVQQNRPDVVIIDRELEQTEQIIRDIFINVPGTLCIALARSPDVATLRRLVAAGARDIVGRPIDYAELTHSLRSLVSTELDRRTQLMIPSAATHNHTRGKLVVVAAPKGGVGTTVVAANLAVALRRLSGGKVALVDFDLQFGDVAVHLNLVPKYTLQDLLPRSEEIDDAMLDRVMQSHASGVSVLLAPDAPEFAGQVTTEQVNRLLDSLCNRYSYVVCDTWTLIDELTEQLMQRADELLVVATPEVPALRNARNFLERTHEQQLTNGRISFVLNRFPSVNGVSIQDVEKHLRHRVDATIPSEGKFVTESVNRGVPVVSSFPKSWVAQSLLKLAAYVSGDDVVPITLSNDPDAAAARTEHGTPGSGERRGILGMLRGQA